MKDYNLNQETRDLLAHKYKLVQGAIATIANAKLGVEVKNPEGIFKSEGGVTVNKREICICEESVYDDFSSSSEETPEEAAVVEAIYEVAAMVNTGGWESMLPYKPVSGLYDPLRRMFR